MVGCFFVAATAMKLVVAVPLALAPLAVAGLREGSPRSLYVHLPFCRRRCFYCDFPVVVAGDSLAHQTWISLGALLLCGGDEVPSRVEAVLDARRGATSAPAGRVRVRRRPKGRAADPERGHQSHLCFDALRAQRDPQPRAGQCDAEVV